MSLDFCLHIGLAALINCFVMRPRLFRVRDVGSGENEISGPASSF